MTGLPGGAQFGGRVDYFRLGSTALSLAIVAVAGIVVVALLARGFGAPVVGQFNQLVAVQLVASQLAAFGVHLSCMHFLGVLDAGEREWRVGARAALLATAGCGAVVALLLLLAAPAIEGLLDSAGLAAGIRWLSLATLLFGINKAAMALLNMADRIHALAFTQAVRPLAWLAGAGWLLAHGEADAGQLGLVLVWGEAACLAFGLAFLARTLQGGGAHAGAGAGLAPWVRQHLAFGGRAMPSHLVTELNTRIDVLVLGVFASDAAVGIYSTAALLAEGVFQVGVLVRTVLARRLTRALVSRDASALAALRRSAGSLSLVGTLLAAAVLALAYRPAIDFFALDPALAEGWPSLLLLLAGVTAAAAHSPFWMALVLAGQPGAHTRLMLVLLAVNLALALLLVPVLGMLGAACATTAMLVMFPWLLGRGVRRSLGFAL